MTTRSRTFVPLTLNVAAGGLFALLSILYFLQAVALAAAAPLWMDEILTLWTARMPDMPAVWTALQKGSEFTPPLYGSLVHVLVKAGISSSLFLRLPSIIAGYLAALAIGVLVRRHAGWSMAALAAGIVLASGLFEFAVQARPYIFVTAAFGWALVLWDGLPEKGRMPRGRLVAFAALLVAMIALHFYAALLVAAIGLGELVRRAMDGRPPRIGVLVVIGIASASILLWWPILYAASAFSGQDVLAPGYYARPDPLGLVTLYTKILGWSGVVALGISLILLTARRGRLTEPRQGMLALMLCAIPVFVFLFAVLITHSFSDRYAIAGTFGIALLMTWVVSQMGRAAPFVAIMLLALLTVASFDRSGGEIAKQDRLDTLRVVNNAPGSLPIAMGSGLRFLELLANAPPHVARRLVYLDLPGTKSWDPTNRHQVERWKAIDHSLSVVAAKEFVCATPRFLLLTDPSGGVDDVPSWLAHLASFTEAPLDRPALTVVSSRSCSTQRH